MSRARIFVLFPLLLVTWLSGCSVHRQQAVTPPSPVPDSFVRQEGPPVEALPIGRWWETFRDEVLNDLMKEALANNLDLEQSFARLSQLQAVTRQAESVLYPSLNVEGEAGRSRQPGITGSSTGTIYSLSLAAGYEVDLWKRNRSGATAAMLEERASREDVRSLFISLSAELADLYYLAVEQRAQIDLTDGTIASFEDTVGLVTRLYVQGLVSALDVYQARQNLSFAQASRPVFEANLAEAEHAISVLLGRYPDRDLAGKMAELPETSEAFPEGLPSQLLARRPDVQAEFLRVQARDARVAEAIADRFPSFNLLGNYGTSRAIFGAGDVTGIFWNLLAGVSQPVIDGGRRKAEVDRTEAAFRESLARYREKVLTSFREVEDALVNNRTTEERIRRLEEHVEATGGALRLSLDRYLLGLSDYLPVLAAQTADFTARSRLLAAKRQLISDRISLARALGGDWMEEEMEPRREASHRKGTIK
ncbi:MAG: efflux transporter outer membrane subunit [Deltaproteobacteria bacterium]|nr:MAG: efflux transporter outer membrane subunit [Deltaproteobacteria bacterium]